MTTTLTSRSGVTVGQHWIDPRTGNRFEIIALSYNLITEEYDVCYKQVTEELEGNIAGPMVMNRQLLNHKRAFLSDHSDGRPRYILAH